MMSPRTTVFSSIAALAGICWFASPTPGQQRATTPLYQSSPEERAAAPQPLTLRDASRDDRWLGLGVRDVRWAPDGSVVYFRWNRSPAPGDVAEADPWFRAGRDGRWAEEVPVGERDAIPLATVRWSADGRRAVWAGERSVFMYDAGVSPAIRAIVSLDRPARQPRLTDGDAAIDFEVGESLYRYAIGTGTLRVLAVRTTPTDNVATDAARWLAEQQRDLFAHVRERTERERVAGVARRAATRTAPQPIPVAAGTTIDDIQATPDGRFITFRARTRDRRRPPTQYVDYVDPSGYARVADARSKVGEPRDQVWLGIVPVDPGADPDSVRVRWVVLPEAGDQATVPHGPFWNLEGTRAVVQFIGEDHRDIWFAELDVRTARTTVVAHDHDDAWIGGPPVQANYLQPALMEWLPGDRFVFASERSGWSHLYAAGPDGSITPLTEGAWEVRGASLSRDRSTWLIQGSRDHPADDQLYTMPAAGGALRRLTDAPGRHEGWWSPDGRRLAVVYGESVQMPDLFVRAVGGGDERRVTVSGNAPFYAHRLVRPEIVSFTHPDGGPLWASLFEPSRPNPERAAVIHVHGGGYRQFAHRGWTVYGYALHLGFINYLVQQGYTVLDFDYRGSAGFGRDYRTDIARSMGIKDTDGMAAAAAYLVRERGIDSARIGVYGVSYGGFLTLMGLFRYPGIFAAGIARAAVTDWAHYSDGWTSRILGVPHEDPEAYRRSSPIYYAQGLADPLLITHGLVDNNVHFQDAARLVQRLIELEKEFEVMYYPVEPHTIETERSRYDYVRRAVGFLERYLRR